MNFFSKWGWSEVTPSMYWTHSKIHQSRFCTLTNREAKCIRELNGKVISLSPGANAHLTGCQWLPMICKQLVNPAVLRMCKHGTDIRYISTPSKKRKNNLLHSCGKKPCLEKAHIDPHQLHQYLLVFTMIILQLHVQL